MHIYIPLHIYLDIHIVVYAAYYFFFATTHNFILSALRPNTIRLSKAASHQHIRLRGNFVRSGADQLTGGNTGALIASQVDTGRSAPEAAGGGAEGD